MKQSIRSVGRRISLLLALSLLINATALPGYSLSAAARSVSTLDTPASRLFSHPGTRPAGQHAAAPQQRDDRDQPLNHVPDPDGRIAFASNRDDNFEIYVMNPDGGSQSRLTNNTAEDVGPTWSPDGSRLAFVSNRDGNPEIYVMNADGSAQTRLTTNPADDLEPAWSPDGTRIAFTSNRDGNDDIFVMDASGANPVNVTANPADDINPAWRPDSARLTFATNRDGNYEIYVVMLNGSGLVNLTNNPATDLHPTWPPGRISFYSDRDGNEEVYTMNGNGANPVRLTTTDALDFDPARAANNGQLIVFVSNRDANAEIYSMNADGAAMRRLTTNDAADIDPAVEALPAAATGATSVQFDTASYSAGEGDGRATITITRTGDTTGATAVDFMAESGTASAVSDFTPVSRVVRFAPGETSQTVAIPIIDDAFVEASETVNLALGNATGATLGTPTTAVLTITDNDGGAPGAAGATIFAVTTVNNLVTFNSATPGTITASVAITGLQSGEVIRGIDVRPRTLQLFAVGSTGRLYSVNPTTGAATAVSIITTAFNGAEYGIDFNPVPDRLRVTSDAEQNLRINVDNGMTTVDGTLAYATGDPNAAANPNIVASAYANNVDGATTTTLYDIDSNLDILVRQDPPNAGTLNTVGALGVNTTELAGFDIAAGSGTAFASLTVAGSAASRLYTINLGTGAATLIGDIGGSAQVRGIAVATRAANPIDEAGFFVRQQYLDFLNREPDAAGLAFWTGELNRLIGQCPSTPGAGRTDCVLEARAQVSTAFFLSIEFQESGFFLIRVYQEAFGRLPTLAEFLEDIQSIREGVVIGQAGASERLAANRRAYLDSFVNREEFRARYDGQTNMAYVDALFTNAGVMPSAETMTRASLIAGLNNGTETRATALGRVGDTGSVVNAQYNRAFVLMQYFGYLRRDPDAAGFAFWLGVLNSATMAGEDARDPAVALRRIRRARIVEAFIVSTEYRQRFGSN